MSFTTLFRNATCALKNTNATSLLSRNTQARMFTGICEPSTGESFECMNRNKRIVKKPNHGKRAVNSLGRRSRTLAGLKGLYPLGMRPGQLGKPLPPPGVPLSSGSSESLKF